MSRIVLPLVATLFLAGCGMNTGPVSSGFGRGPAPDYRTSSADTPALRESLGNSSSRVASLETSRRGNPSRDLAPQGEVAKAPPGALADRNYAATRLEPEKARDMINAYRRSKGLRPLALNTALTEAAKAHSRDLARWDRISHYGSDGSNPWDRVKRTGYNARLAAENVGTGQASLEEVFKGWQNSPGHNKNLLLTDAREMGIALVQDDKTEFKTFWTLVIGTSM